ncbi:iron hydrogenase [Kockovaella imperatae]|uniref:Iron hydrogenase n=1 Tax=Kockovaella imperatae TaxID=4999 RepID=A0A1Y1URV4_9TREE|nr:iron hydrogenase [Kockovaella imperatae]ORX40699.1 iron hydrogenase [Kockovaella imperatae]
MAFSGALTITDLDDFLTPSQACIIPVRGSVPGKQDDGSTEIQIDDSNTYYEVSTYPTSSAGPSSGSAKALGKKALEKAEINLNDCLACSGCITSTESMLITLQSHNEVLSFISESASSTTAVKTPVLSISPQTLASLSTSYASSSSTPPIPLLILLRRIRYFMATSQNGKWRTWDTTFARHLSLRETVAEFQERRQWSAKGKEVAWDSSSPEPGPLPVLASACPGWVCYAEKAQGDMLPLLSQTRSSQAVMGGLVKTWWAKMMDLSPSDIYHVTAMPCYDKKLEASRSDFYSAAYSTRDVDCVLTTGELDLLLSELGFNPFTPSPEEHMTELDATSLAGSPWPELLNHPGSSSGSYLASIIDLVAASHPSPTRLVTREIRDSTDNVEYLLEEVSSGEIIFKGIKCYGFRNLQNLVRKVGKETGLVKSVRTSSKLSAALAARRRKSRMARGGEITSTPTPIDSDAESLTVPAVKDEKKVDFVEVMACPSGCVNGGGQMKPVSSVARKVLDEEGYERPLPDDGTDLGMTVDSGIEKLPEDSHEGTRWSTKDWVAKVEAVYWNGLPTPPPSPKADPVDLTVQRGKTESEKHKLADELAHQVINDVTGNDAAARWEFLRTRFRKVEGDVLSNGGLTHEAVKW